MKSLAQKFEELLDRLHAKKNGAQWVALCPAHEDKNPSLSVAEKNGKILLHCHAGCSPEAVCEVIGLDLADLFAESGNERGSRIVAAYDYVDESGNLLFQAVRFAPKTFKQRKPDGNGGWTWNLNGARKVLYYLPEVLSADSLLIVEGEKDVETARSMGLVATCNPMGAGKWKDEYSEFLRGKNVTIIPDADEVGRKHAEQVAKSLAGKAASISICHLPEDTKAKDISDWPLSAASLIDLIKKAPVWQPETEKRMESYSVSALFSARDQSVNFLVWPLLAPGLAVVVDALPKDGKSVLLFRGILAARQDKPFLGYATHPVRALYISEQSAGSLGMQLRECGYDGSEPVEELGFITREIWSRYVFDDFVRTVEKDFLPGGYNVIVWDTFATIARLEDEKDAAEINRCANLVLDLASRHSLATCVCRHDRKSGGDIGVSGRGSGQLSGLVDLILHLTRIPGADCQRKLETRGRVPGLPAIMKIELMPTGEYLNWGEPLADSVDRAGQVAEWYSENSEITAPEIVSRFAAMAPPIVVTDRTARRDLAKAKADK